MTTSPIQTPNQATIERFLGKVFIVNQNDDDSCWYWDAAKDSDGYGRFWFEGRVIRAHRFSFTTFRTEIPEGLELDHLCHNRACCNPFHLEPVTGEENKARMHAYQATIRAKIKRLHMLRTPKEH